ncbi:MAG: NfeD family protein [Solirubrobacteraceae bacterium]|jgi:membrane-bound serine protease (ClpP class)
MTALGVSLLIIGAIVVVAEAHVSSMGILGGPGVVALAIGTVLAVGGLGGGLLVGLVSALLVAIAASAMLVVTLQKAGAVRRRRIRSGPEGMIGSVGEVRSWEGPAGKVLVEGALWRARKVEVDDEADDLLAPGDAIVVERRNGLTLGVRRAESWELVP